MSIAVKPPTVLFPEWYDDRAEYEATARGYLGHVVVRLDDGRRYELEFWDRVRLGQDLETMLVESGDTVFAEPNMIVLPEITTDAVKEAVQKLWSTGYFQQLSPID